MQLHDVANDGEPEPEPAVLPGGRAVGLAEALEDDGQKLRCDAVSVVLDADGRPGLVALHDDANVSARARELHGVGEEIPCDLTETLGITDDGDARIGGVDGDDDPLRVGRRLHDIDRLVHYRDEVDGLRTDLELAGDDA